MTDLEEYIAKCEACAVPDSHINTTDIPELTEEAFARGRFKSWKPLKQSVPFRIDFDNLSWLQSKGVKGYQKRMNEVIRWARQNGCPLV